MKLIYFFHCDRQLAEMYRALFELSGYRFRQASEKQACLALLEEENPTVIILSLLLDRAAGFGFLEELSQHPERKHVPVFVYTQLAEREDVRTAKRLGCSGYFIQMHTKPEVLVDRIQQVIA